MSPQAMKLEGELTIYRAAELKPLLLQAVQPGATLEVDLSGVTELDTAGVQLLIMLQAEAKARGVTLRWLGYSLAVEEVLELLDLEHVLGRPSAVVWS